MKVKCKGYTGNLKSINPVLEVTDFRDKQRRYRYEVQLSLSQYEEVTISNVGDEDIEFIKEEQ